MASVPLPPTEPSDASRLMLESGGSLIEVVDQLKVRLLQTQNSYLENERGLLQARERRAVLEEEQRDIKNTIQTWVTCPPLDGADHTLHLPDEVLLNIFLMLNYKVVFSRIAFVCRRWRRVVSSPVINRVFRTQIRFAKFAQGSVSPFMIPEVPQSKQVSWSLAISKDGRYLFCASRQTGKHDIRVFSCKEYTHVANLTGHTASINALACCSDGRLISASKDGTLRVWSTSDFSHKHTLTGHDDGVVCVAIADDTGVVYSGAYDNTIRVWCGEDLEHKHTLIGAEDTVCSLVPSTAHMKLYSGTFGGLIHIWHLDTHELLQSLEGHRGRVHALVVSHHHLHTSRLFSASEDHTIRVWDCDTHTHLQTLTAHRSWVYALAISKEGMLFSSSGDLSVRIWSCADGELLHTLPCHEWALSLALTPNSKLFTGLKNSQIAIW